MDVLITIGIMWGLPILIGVWFSTAVWVFSRKLDYRIAAILRAFAVAATFTPGYVSGAGVIPVPASIFLFFTPTDSTFTEQLSASVMPVLVVWLLLIPALIVIGMYFKQGKQTK